MKPVKSKKKFHKEGLFGPRKNNQRRISRTVEERIALKAALVKFLKKASSAANKGADG